MVYFSASVCFSASIHVSVCISLPLLIKSIPLSLYNFHVVLLQHLSFFLDVLRYHSNTWVKFWNSDFLESIINQSILFLDIQMILCGQFGCNKNQHLWSTYCEINVTLVYIYIISLTHQNNLWCKYKSYCARKFKGF